MVNYTKNVVKFSGNAPSEKLQELISKVLVPGKDGDTSLDIRSLVSWPESGKHRDVFWDTASSTISGASWDADVWELSFAAKWGPPMFALETLAKAFPEAEFTWYNASDDCSIVGYGTAKQGDFTVDVPGAPTPAEICKICYGGCVLDGEQCQCENCPRVRLRNS